VFRGGFFQLLFLLFVYGFILSKSSALISDGSELLLRIINILLPTKLLCSKKKTSRKKKKERSLNIIMQRETYVLGHEAQFVHHIATEGITSSSQITNTNIDFLKKAVQ